MEWDRWIFFLFKSKSEHIVILDEFSFIDQAVSQHCPPGALEIVIGVEHISRGEDGVTSGHLDNIDIISSLLTSSKAHLEPGDGQDGLLLIEELGEHEVAWLHDGAEVHVQVRELVMLQRGAICALGVSHPLLKVVIRVGEVLCI